MILLSMLVCSVAQGASPSSGPPSGHPLDYFPLKVGTSWTYTITFPGKRDPLMYEETVWPREGGGGHTTASRGYFHWAKRNAAKTHTLSYRVKRMAPQQGPFKFPMGVELEVVEDTLGYFAECKQVFLKASQHPGQEFMGYLLMIFEPGSIPGSQYSMGAWGTWSSEPGYRERFMFFGSRPQIAIEFRRGNREAQEDLLFQGVERVPESHLEGLRFIRRVKPSLKDHAQTRHPFDVAFSEDTWFVRGQGLVRLVQTVEGEITMVWKLARAM